MKNKAAIIVLSVLFALLLVNAVFAHSGMTDASGGHWDNEYNEYHYHCGGNPAHKHYGGICPYNRIPADTSNKDSYGNGNSNSGTRKEDTMDIWDVILLGAIGLFVVLPIVIVILSSIGDKMREKRKNNEHKQQDESTSLINDEQENAELRKIIADLENENKELKRANSEKGEIIASLSSLNKEQLVELDKVRKENEKLKNNLQEAKNSVADANYEVIKTREKDRVDIESLTQNLVHAFNDYEVLNKYYRSTSKGKLENAFNTNLTVSKILRFNLEAEIISEGEKGINKYNTTFDSCTCEDYRFRCKKEGTSCKHMLYLMYSFGVLQLQPERLKASFLVGKNKNN